MFRKPPRDDREESSNDPYEILILAAPFILGGIILLLHTGAGLISAHRANAGATDSTLRRGIYRDVIDPPLVHAIGVIGLVIGVGLVLFYFYVRSQPDDRP